MPKPRSCPHCHEVIPVNRGFTFDNDLNLVCSGCGKVAYRAQRTSVSRNEGSTGDCNNNPNVQISEQGVVCGESTPATDSASHESKVCDAMGESDEHLAHRGRFHQLKPLKRWNFIDP